MFFLVCFLLLGFVVSSFWVFLFVAFFGSFGSPFLSFCSMISARCGVLLCVLLDRSLSNLPIIGSLELPIYTFAHSAAPPCRLHDSIGILA